jgi:hypothetical protein
MVCEAASWSLVLQQPSRKNPVIGASLQEMSFSPKTFSDGAIVMLIFQYP